LLCTLGGTDKRDDSSKIGMFGMGFFAIFNPKLGTERVVVTTCCEGSSVEVSFHVETPGKCPKISLRVLDEPLPFSTRIEVQFNRITLLCKYERLTELEIASLGKGGHGLYSDLRDYYESGFCVFRGIRAVLNCNSLSVTPQGFVLSGLELPGHENHPCE
jgi:hypothetical protein